MSNVYKVLEKRTEGARLCAEDIPLIRGLFAHNLSNKEIADKFECSVDAIYRIRKGKAWTRITEVAK